MPIDNLTQPLKQAIVNKKLFKSTTVWLIIAAIFPIIAQYAKGEIDLVTMISAIVIALAGIHSTAKRLKA